MWAHSVVGLLKKSLECCGGEGEEFKCKPTVLNLNVANNCDVNNDLNCYHSDWSKLFCTNFTLSFDAILSKEDKISNC